MYCSSIIRPIFFSICAVLAVEKSPASPLHHWLRVTQRMMYKFAVLTYGVLHDSAHRRQVDHSLMSPINVVEALRTLHLHQTSGNGPNADCLPSTAKLFRLIHPRLGTFCLTTTSQHHHLLDSSHHHLRTFLFQHSVCS